MSRLKIATPNKAQLTVERLYKDLERRIIASPPGLCPVDLQLSFLKMCHAQTCGKCVPCRVGLGQLQNLMEDVLAGKATLKTLDLIRVDYIITAGEKLNLLEVNTTPGMTTTSFIPQQVRAAGLDIKDVMTDIIENKF